MKKVWKFLGFQIDATRNERDAAGLAGKPVHEICCPWRRERQYRKAEYQPSGKHVVSDVIGFHLPYD